MKTIEQRKAKLEVMEDAIEALEKVLENTYEWEMKWKGYDGLSIDEILGEDEKRDYEKILYKMQILKEMMYDIENKKV